MRQGLSGAAGVRAERMDFSGIAGADAWSGDGLILETSQRVAGAGEHPEGWRESGRDSIRRGQ